MSKGIEWNFVFSCVILLFAGVLSEETFDFIIAGGGTAGCVLANRLSAKGNYKVLVLEAGKEPPELTRIPVLSSKFQWDPNVTFQFESVPQQKAGLDKDGIIKITVGKTLGGSSTINNMRFNRAQHGYQGPISVSSHSFGPGREAWLSAANQLGYPVADPNGPQTESFTPVEFSTKFGRRVSAYTGYLKNIVKSRPNLKIITNSFVTEVVFEGKTAVGVKYITTTFGINRTTIAYADKDIILSAGAYGSPTILMRSGYGPKDVLSRAGIPQVKELPVGKNFQEHPQLPLQFVLGDKSLSINPQEILSRENFELFRKTGTGPLTLPNGYSGQAFVTSNLGKREGRSTWPDIEYALTSLTTRLGPFQNVTLAPWETTIIVYAYITRQYSRGRVELNSENSLGAPIVDFNYLDDSRDEQVFLDAIKILLDLFEKTPTYKNLGARYLPDPLPACRQHKFRSESYWKCYTRQMIFGGYHPTGTCSMGSVVDSKLKVFGVDRLRVVDGGIMPVITNANLQAAVYAIAEKGADMILQEWS